MVGKRVNIYLDEELTKQSKKAAIDIDLSLSALIRKLLREYLSNKKE